MEHQPPSSSSPSNCEHDVFLSFRGEDTRYGFTDHLHYALLQRKIMAFRDSEKLVKGDPVLSKLYEAIHKSKFAVIVLSTNYATSTWCLDELVHIVECKDLVVLPVFYHVDPSEIRKQNGNYGVAFAKHEIDFKNNISKVDKWRNALRDICSCAGWHVPRDRSEVEVIQGIVDRIIHELYSMLSDPNRELVGIDARIEEIESHLELQSNDILTVGIWGMGGIGKTTLANEVFKKISNQFNRGHRFIYEVKSLSQDELVQCLCKSVLGISNINNVKEGIKLLKRALSTEKVLIVLDDVVSFNQIECLAPPYRGPLGHNIWGAGSRLIITTRDRSSLMRNCNAHENDLYEVEKLRVYEVGKLTDDEAHQLLCQEAYKNGILPENFEASSDLSKSFLQYAGGIPLAHRVLGHHLSRVKVEFWSEILHSLDNDRDKEIFGVLQGSYDGLQDTEKNIFLDIACFFYGEDLVRVQNIFSGLDYASPSEGIKNLVNKSLIKIERGKLQMHDLLRCLCWHIVREENKKQPGKRSRLWIDDNTNNYGSINSWRFEDARNVLMDNAGTCSVEGLFLNLHQTEEMLLDDDPFLQLSGLRLMKIYHVKFLGEPFTQVSKNLRVIEWHECPLQSLPHNFRWVNLVEIKMPNSCIEQLWNGKLSLRKLKLVDLSHCQSLVTVPDFSLVPNLERLILHGCNELSELHHTIWNHPQLKYLNLEGCTSLQIPPQYLSMRSFQIYIHVGCSKLLEFPEVKENMDMLSELHLR